MGINFEILDNKNQPQGNKSVRNVKKNQYTMIIYANHCTSVLPIFLFVVFLAKMDH